MVDVKLLKKKLMEGDFQSAIDLLDDFLFTHDTTTHNYLVILSFKYNQISRNRNLGIVDYETYQMAISQIQIALLEDVFPKVERVLSLLSNKNLSEDLDLLQKKRREISVIEKRLMLEDELNVLITKESLEKYLKKKFQKLPFNSYENHFEDVFILIDSNKYKYLRDLDLIFSLTEKARENYKIGINGNPISQLTHLDLAIACIDSEYRHQNSNWSDNARTVFSDFITNAEFCSFCGGNKKDKILLISGMNAYICETCIDEAVRIKEVELKK